MKTIDRGTFHVCEGLGYFFCELAFKTTAGVRSHGPIARAAGST